MQSLKIHNSKKEAIKLVKKAANNIGLNLEDESLSSGKIHLYSSGNLFSFGSKIDVKISTRKQPNCLIEVSSRSSAMIQVIDWGTNSKLEEQLIGEIKKLLLS